MRLKKDVDKKNAYLVLVANASQARYFAREKKFSQLRELDNRVHPESRMKGIELERDAPGQVFQSGNPSEDSMGEASTPKKKEAEKFAHLLAADLKKARGDGVFDKLILVAAPSFLGVLRNTLDEQTAKLLVEAIPKNVTTESPEAIQEVIDAALRD